MFSVPVAADVGTREPRFPTVAVGGFEVVGFREGLEGLELVAVGPHVHP